MARMRISKHNKALANLYSHSVYELDATIMMVNFRPINGEIPVMNCDEACLFGYEDVSDDDHIFKVTKPGESRGACKEHCV